MEKKLLTRFRILLGYARRIPFVVPYWKREEYNTILNCLLTFSLVHGHASEAFTKAFCEKFKIQYAVSFNLGRSALDAALQTLDIQEGDEVILPSLTCLAVALPILKKKAIPVFCDVGEDMNMSFADFQQKVSSKTKGVIIVHHGGKLLSIGPFLTFCRKRNIAVVEDACQALGAQYPDGTFAGLKGDIGIFSFSMGKNVMATAGGMAVTNDQKLYQKMLVQAKTDESGITVFKRVLYRLFRHAWGKYFSLFFNSLEFLRLLFERKQKKQRQLPLYKVCRLSNLDASILLFQLKKLDTIISLRKKYARKIFNIVTGYGGVASVDDKNNIFTKYYLIFPRAALPNPAGTADLVQQCWDYLACRGVELEHNYTPMHLKSVPVQGLRLPKTEFLAGRSIAIPVRPNLTEKEMKRICMALQTFLNKMTMRQH